jgi:SAM-dependent methyltransferase
MRAGMPALRYAAVPLHEGHRRDRLVTGFSACYISKRFMKERLLKFLECPACSGRIVLADGAESEGIEIITGQLNCVECAKVYPVVAGVPRFADLVEVGEEKAAIAAGFGWEWKHFTQHDEKYGEQLLGWLNPVQPEFFKDKIVLDGGCGKGRHLKLAIEWGARDVIGVDLSEAVDTAFDATRGEPNIHVVQADICRLPLARAFDYAFSVGVLDHLPDSIEGFQSLVSKVKPGGHVSAWVYGAENNGWITGLVNPLRVHFTSRLKPQTLFHLSKLPTVVLFLATKLIYGPLSRIGDGRAARRLYYGDYLGWLSRFGWREQHSIVFDHLVAPTAHYLTRAQFEAWWTGIDAREVKIGWHNKNSWRGFGRLKNFSGETP